MTQILFVVAGVVRTLLTALMLLMVVRALLSWFPMEENRLTDFLFAVTEPVIMPIRALLERFEFARNMPVDLSFFVTFLLISILVSIL